LGWCGAAAPAEEEEDAAPLEVFAACAVFRRFLAGVALLAPARDLTAIGGDEGRRGRRTKKREDWKI
jgi:hypothetical protein